MKQLIKIALLCLFPLMSMAQTPAYQKTPRSLRVTDNGQIYKWKDSLYYKNLLADSLGRKVNISDSLVKYVTPTQLSTAISDIPPVVASVFGRVGAINAQSSDYSSFYPLLNGTGATGSWNINAATATQWLGAGSYEATIHDGVLDRLMGYNSAENKWTYYTPATTLPFNALTATDATYWGGVGADFLAASTTPIAVYGFDQTAGEARAFSKVQMKSFLEVPDQYNNGLTKTGSTVKLGGALTGTTDIGTYNTSFQPNLRFTPSKGVALSFSNTAAATYSSIKVDYGGVMIMSESAASSAKQRSLWFPGNNTGSSIVLVDNSKLQGIINGGDYEANFIPRSLVTKKYVDSLVTGLGTGTVTSVSSSDANISVATSTTTPVLTLASTISSNTTGNAATATTAQGLGSYAYVDNDITTDFDFSFVRNGTQDIKLLSKANLKTALGIPSGGETLQSVSDRGNETTKTMIIGNPLVAGAGIVSFIPSETLPFNIQGALGGFGPGDITLQTAGGRVGIGTTTPTAKLDVNGTGKFSGTVNTPEINTDSLRFTDVRPLYFGSIAGGATSPGANKNFRMTQGTAGGAGNSIKVEGQSFGVWSESFNITVSGIAANKLSSNTAPTFGNDVVRLTDLGTGWAQYTDNVYTSASPLVVNASTTATITNNSATSIENQLPIGVGSFYNSGTSKITPQLDGDSYLINVRFTAESSSVTGLCDVGIDIGGAMNIVSQETVSLRKGVGNSQRVNIVFDVFSGSTFLSNGGLIKLTSIDGNTSIYDISYKITRTHKAK